ncbi:MAG: 1-phosphofructokinase [Clostridiales bacterium]|nr:1-phosphofructokinase [Clostridiales bacterium]
MIITVTPNPAIDRFVTVRDFFPGGLNRVLGTRCFSGGKGNNVARIIHGVDARCVATGFLSGQVGMGLEQSLTREGVECAFVYTSGETRTNTKIIDEKTRVCTELNESGPPASDSDVQRLEEKLAAITGKEDIVVFSGSVPEGLPEDIYARLIRFAKSIGAKIVLDADGAFLREGIRANPDAIKPNIHELSKIAGKELVTPLAVASTVRALRLAEDRTVLVSMGRDGAMLFHNGSAWIADAPDVPVVSTVGAGDAMTASLAISLNDGTSDEDVLRDACAYAAGAVMSEHFEHLTPKSILAHRENIRVRRFK